MGDGDESPASSQTFFSIAASIEWRPMGGARFFPFFLSFFLSFVLLFGSLGLLVYKGKQKETVEPCLEKTQWQVQMLILQIHL